MALSYPTSMVLVHKYRRFSNSSHTLVTCLFFADAEVTSLSVYGLMATVFASSRSASSAGANVVHNISGHALDAWQTGTNHLRPTIKA